MPPISVYRIGEVYFVRDGHHRVSVARALGRTDIDAYVVESSPASGPSARCTVGDLPTKSHERLFHERVPLPARARDRDARARRLELRHPGRGGRGVGLPRHAGARASSWTAAPRRAAGTRTSSCPWSTMLREADMLGDRTEADAYLGVAAQRYRLLFTHEWSEDVLARLRDATAR